MHPFYVEQQTFHNIIKLYSNVRRVQIDSQKDTPAFERKHAQDVIRRPAGDDWF